METYLRRYVSVMKEKRSLGMTMRKIQFLQHKEKHWNNKTEQTDPWTFDVKKWPETQHAEMQHVGTKDWHSNIAYRNVPNARITKKYNILSDLKTLLGRDCEVEKIMRFLKDIEMFQQI